MTLFLEDTKKEIRYILIGTVIGFLLQFIAGEYLKRHPDHLNSNSSKDARPPIAKPEKSNPLSRIWIIKKLRGGSIWKTETFTSLEREKFLSSVDPIFLLIHFKKSQIALESILSKPDQTPNRKRSLRKVFGRLRLPFDRKFLTYLVLGFLTIGSPEVIPRSLVQEQKINSTSWLKEISEISEEEIYPSSTLIQAGDKLLTISSTSEKIVEDPFEPIEKETNLDLGKRKMKSRAKKASKRPAKVVRFSDLPPLPDSDFTEIIQELKSSSKIRIKNS